VAATVQSPGALDQAIPKYSREGTGDRIKPAGCLPCMQVVPTHQRITQERKKRRRELCVTGLAPRKANHAHPLPLLMYGAGTPNLLC